MLFLLLNACFIFILAPINAMQEKKIDLKPAKAQQPLAQDLLLALQKNLGTLKTLLSEFRALTQKTRTEAQGKKNNLTKAIQDYQRLFCQYTVELNTGIDHLELNAILRVSSKTKWLTSIFNTAHDEKLQYISKQKFKKRLRIAEAAQEIENFLEKSIARFNNKAQEIFSLLKKTQKLRDMKCIDLASLQGILNTIEISYIQSFSENNRYVVPFKHYSNLNIMDAWIRTIYFAPLLIPFFRNNQNYTDSTVQVSCYYDQKIETLLRKTKISQAPEFENLLQDNGNTLDKLIKQLIIYKTNMLQAATIYKENQDWINGISEAFIRDSNKNFESLEKNKKLENNPKVVGLVVELKNFARDLVTLYMKPVQLKFNDEKANSFCTQIDQADLEEITTMRETFLIIRKLNVEFEIHKKDILEAVEYYIENYNKLLENFVLQKHT